MLAPWASLPHMSGDFSRSNARGRSDLHSPNDAGTSQTHDRPGIRQDRRGMNAASSPFRQESDSRLAATGRSGFRQQIDGWAGRERHYASKLEIRATRQAFRGPVDRQAPIFRQESEGGIRTKLPIPLVPPLPLRRWHFSGSLATSAVPSLRGSVPATSKTSARLPVKAAGGSGMGAVRKKNAAVMAAAATMETTLNPMSAISYRTIEPYRTRLWAGGSGHMLWAGYEPGYEHANTKTWSRRGPRPSC